MEAHRLRPRGFEQVLARHPDYAGEVLAEVRARGPLAAEALHHPAGSERRLPESWFGTFPRATLEAFFGRGELAVAGRLLVLAAHLEAGHRAGEVTEPLATELGQLAAWLGLEEVRVARRGRLAAALAAEVRSR